MNSNDDLYYFTTPYCSFILSNYIQGYEELLVHPQQQQKGQSIPLVPISSLEDWAQMVFEGVENFNRLQSWVFDCAYNTDNNMLVCAPTGMYWNLRE